LSNGFDVNEAKIILNAEMEELEQFVKKTLKTLCDAGRPLQLLLWNLYGTVLELKMVLQRIFI